jgi:hypothetical protein
MRTFKFLRNPLLDTHDGGYIFPGEYFYSMNKEEIVRYTNTGERKVTPKYTIVQRCIHPIYKDVFKPDHEVLWYFRSKSNAEWLKNIWERDDRMTLGGENVHHNSDITITFNR